MEKDFYHVNYYADFNNSNLMTYDERLIAVGCDYLLFYSIISKQSILNLNDKKVHAYIHGIMKTPFYKYDFKQGHLISRIITLDDCEKPRAIFMVENLLGLEAQIYLSH